MVPRKLLLATVTTMETEAMGGMPICHRREGPEVPKGKRSAVQAVPLDSAKMRPTPTVRYCFETETVVSQKALSVRGCHPLKDNGAMSGIRFVTDEKGRKVGVLIDLKKHGAIWEDFWDGLVSESRRKEKGIPYEQYRANRTKRTRARG
jgi:hypothetical protein